jgi:hypothetical protein
MTSDSGLSLSSLFSNFTINENFDEFNWINACFLWQKFLYLYQQISTQYNIRVLLND